MKGNDMQSLANDGDACCYWGYVSVVTGIRLVLYGASFKQLAMAT